MDETLLFDKLDDVGILVHGELPPSDRDWNAWVEALEGWAAGLRGVVVVTDEAGPNSAQRAKLDAVVKRNRGIPTAVLTHSSVARGIVTVLSWLNPLIRAYRPTGLTEALDYLKVDRARRNAVLERIMDMRIRLSAAPASSRAHPSHTIAKMEELMTHRLPRLRDQLERR